jgi:polyisoprenoid-binding protein YceI
MKTRVFAVGMALLIALAPVAASPQTASTQTAEISALAPGTYVLDRRHASLILRVSHQNFSLYTLRFTGLEARFAYDPANPQQTSLAVRVDPNSIDTATGGDTFGKMFDAQLLGADWLDAKQFPQITFKSTSLDPGDGRTGTITGDLTLHGVTRPLTLKVTFNGTGKAIPGGEIKAGFSATGTVKRSEFGVSRFFPVLGDELQLNIEVEFIKQ